MAGGTATTLGRFLIDEALPAKYRGSGDEQLTKKKVYSALAAAAKDNPDGYAEIVDAVKSTGDYFASMEGLSVGLDDIAPQTKKRDPVIQEAMRKIRGVESPAKRRQVIRGVSEKMLSLAAEHPSDMALMARSGGRGNASQLQKTVTARVYAQDDKGDVIPWLIQRSYAEGLRPDESWVSGVQDRQDAIASKESVQEPGAFSKVVMSNMSNQVVTQHDCGTDTGIQVSVDDPQLTERFLAQAAGGVPTTRAVTAADVRALKKAGLKHVMARSPLACEADEGICAMCYGNNEWGKLPAIGTNVGARSSQAMGEPLTQFALNAKHGVRTLSDTPASMRGLTGLKNYLDFPKSFTDRAVLSSRTGTVTRVEAAPQGGHYVDVDGKEHYLGPRTPPKVRKGDRVEIGDALSKGIPTPDDVVAYKGLGAGRAHVADTVHRIYQEQGKTLDKRHTELLARSHLNWVRVVDDPTGDQIPGEIIPMSTAAKRFKQQTRTVTLDNAAGKTLGRQAAHLPPGTKLTPSLVKSLRDIGVDTVHVYTGDLRVRPVVKSITRSPLLDPSWMRRMGHRYLRKSLEEGAAAGDTSDIHGADPVAAYVFGAEFGEGDGWRY